MKTTRTLIYVIIAAALVGGALLVAPPAGSGAAPDLTATLSATPRYRVNLPHIRYDLTPTPTATPTLPPTPLPPSYSASASLYVTRFKPINASTFNSSSLIVTNDSLNGERLAELRIDLSTALLPDVVFDPHGEAGDAVAKDLTQDLRQGTSVANHSFEGAQDGGFRVLILRFNDFDRGDRSELSIDIDPTSIKGASAPGPAESGSVGGLELVGATVTATFDNGATYTGQFYRLPEAGAGGATHSGALVVLRDGLPPRPSISVAGVNPPAVVSNTVQTVHVVGPPGRPVTVLVMESGLFLEGVPNGGFDIDPFEANSAVDVREYQAVIGNSGFVNVSVILSKQNAESGIHAISAVFDNHYGLKGLVAAPLILELE